MGREQSCSPGTLVRLSLVLLPLSLLTFLLLRVLPEWLPFHPHRWWIHCRMVYLPMSYLYGSRFKAKETDLILSLREVRSCAAISLLSTELLSLGIVYPGLLFYRVGRAGQQRLQSRLVCAAFRSFRWPKRHPRPV